MNRIPSGRGGIGLSHGYYLTTSGDLCNGMECGRAIGDGTVTSTPVPVLNGSNVSKVSAGVRDILSEPRGRWDGMISDSSATRTLRINQHPKSSLDGRGQGEICVR